MFEVDQGKLKRVRKVVQISTCVIDDAPVVFALCDDGTIWNNFIATGYGWSSVETIPQGNQ